MKYDMPRRVEFPVWLLVVLAHPLGSSGRAYAKWRCYSVEVDHAARAISSVSPQIYASVVLAPDVQVAVVAKGLRAVMFPMSRVWMFPSDFHWTPDGGIKLLKRFIGEPRAFPTLTQSLSRS